MHILKYTKLKNGQYKLSFDNLTNALLHEDLILKNNLLITKEITEEQLETLLEENNSYIAYSYALDYLKVKMRSKKELREYLLKKEIKDCLIEDAIILLSKQGYLNDEIYSKAFIHDRIALSSDGPYKIKDSLIKLGVEDSIVITSLEIFDKELEEERITKIIGKQVKSNHNKSEYALKRKLIDYLVNLGYSKELVIRKVNDIEVEDKDILKKEYDKIYNRLSKKYSGKELEYKIKQKLYQKGFYNH